MPVSIDFTGKIALVTGGSRGIGLAIVKQLAKAGANIAFTYSSTPADELAALLESLRAEHADVRFEAFQLEASSSESYKRLLPAILASETLTGSLDIIVANAGISLWSAAEATADRDMQKLFEVNAYGPYYLFRECMSLWGEANVRNKVGVVVSSISGRIVNLPQKQSAYNASKAATTAFTQSLAAEWAHTGFRINCISPGYIYSDMISSVDKSWTDDWLRRTPLGRMGTTEEVGKAVMALCSDQFTFMTGTDVVMDGGYTLL